MVKRRNQPLIDSETSSDDDASDSEFLALTKKKQKLTNSNNRSNSDSSGSEQHMNNGNLQRRIKRTKKMSKSSSSASSEDESESSSNSGSYSENDDIDNNQSRRSTNTQIAQHLSSSSAATAIVSSTIPQSAITSSSNSANSFAQKRNNKHDDDKSEPEEGQVTSSDSDDSSDSEFNDGFDENLMGDEEDRIRLENLSEKERETEIFKRIERRDVMRTRWEIERKLRQVKKAERAKDKPKLPKDKKIREEKRLRRQKERESLAAAEAAAAERLLILKHQQQQQLLLQQQQQQQQQHQQQQLLLQQQQQQQQQYGIQQSVSAAASSSTNNAVSGVVGGGAVGNSHINSLTSSSSMSSITKNSANIDKNKDSPTMSASINSNTADNKRDEEFNNAHEYFDPKERSKERKKTVEMNKTDDKRTNAMALLKARREGKQKREEEEAKRQAERDLIQEDKDDLEGVTGGVKSAIKLKTDDVFTSSSGSDSDSDSDNDDDDKRSGKRSGNDNDNSSSDLDNENKSASIVTNRPIYIQTKDDLNKIRLSRHKMERFLSLPFFDKVVTNCFVRISIGNSNNRPVYRVAEIVGVVETGKIYNVGKVRTNKGLLLRHGSQERVFRVEFISNQDFSDTEYTKWCEICATLDVDMPTMDLIKRKQKEIQDAVVYEFKDEDVHRIIEEKNRFRKHPTNYAVKKTSLLKERDAALTRGDDDVAKELSTQINELEERANELDKRRSSSISLISYINDRNRKRNIEQAEKAIIEEVRATRGLKIDDPFTRRSTKPTMAFKSREHQEELQMMVPAPPPPGRKRQDEEKKLFGPADNNLYSLHDFEISLDLDLPVNTNVLPKPISQLSDTTPKRSLNLEDYKKKRGLI